MLKNKLFEKLHAKAKSTAIRNSLLKAYKGPAEPINLKALKLSSESIQELLAEGFLNHDKGLFYPGFLLNFAAKDLRLTDLSYFLPLESSDLLHRDILQKCMRVSKTKTMPLLHAPYLTSHYFDTDRLIASSSPARRLVVNAFRELLQLLSVDFLSCTISPEGLIGTYPLCFHLALASNMDVVAALRRRLGGIEFVGGVRPRKGTVLLINDVLTTGTSILQMSEELTRSHSKLIGVLVLYDRHEGGKELLEQSDIPVVSLMSVQSLRSYCEHVAAGRLSSLQLKRKAAEFLTASHRLQFQSRSFQLTTTPEPRIGIAPAVAPSLEAFDPLFQFKPRERKAQLRLIADTLQTAVKSNCSMLIMPELTVPLDVQSLLAVTTKQHPIIVVAGAEYTSLNQNVALIAIRGEVFEQPKLVRSPYDLKEMKAGDRITIFKDTYVGNFAVLVCADQVNYQAIDGLKGQVDVLVVVSRNRAIKTFASMAAGDAYRIYSFIIVANDRSCGDSLVASPEKGVGKVRWLDKARLSSNLVCFELPVERLRHRDQPFLKEIVFDSSAAAEKDQ
jgi:orotate phosphoribosyltransferase